MRIRFPRSQAGAWCVMLGFAVCSIEAAAQQAYPAPGASYSAAVVSPPGATLAVLGGISGEQTDLEAAAATALGRLAARLHELGLDRGQILRVRAALAPGGDFAAWNRGWTTFFAGVTPPARTTVYSSGLPGGASVVLDAVAMFPAGSGPLTTIQGISGEQTDLEAAAATALGRLAARLHELGTRTTLNPNLRLARPAANPTAIVSTGSGLFLSSGALPGRNLDDPTSLEAHIRSSMNSLGRTLAGQGLQWHDAFFVRLMPTPQPDRSAPDFAAWSPVYETLDQLTGGHAPPYTMWAAPGFGSTGRFSEIEVWAVPPSPPAVFSMPDESAQNPLLRMSGSARSFIASGATIAPNAALAWLSGIVAPAGTAPEEEAAAAVAIMKERVSALGATLADVAELRVYRVAAGTDGDELASAWNEVYGAEWNNEATNPHKPVRTNYLVGSLPGGRHVEVEAIIVLPPGQF